jgi:uncharacterized protein
MSLDAEFSPDPHSLSDPGPGFPDGLSGEIDIRQPQPKKSRRPYWGPWATLLWTVLAIVVMLFGQIFAAVIYIIVRSGGKLGANIQEILTDGNLLAISSIVGTIPGLGLIATVIAVRGCSIREYLALRGASPRQIVLAIIGIVLLIALGDAITYLLGRPIVTPEMSAVFKNSWLPLLLFAVVVVAPIGEELLFRGFTYQGIAASRWGPTSAIVISAIIWAALHVQYDSYGIVTIGLVGIYLGIVRRVTLSVPLTILLHAINNAISSVETYFLS